MVRMLNVDAAQPQGDHIVVDKSEGLLKVLDEVTEAGRPIPGHDGLGPRSASARHWKVTTYAFLPPFNYQPDLFWDVADDKAEQRLPPGPNGPVGVAWLDLTKDHYGIHGTNEPQTIGRDPEPRLLAPDQLGRDSAVANDQAGL